MIKNSEVHKNRHLSFLYIILALATALTYFFSRPVIASPDLTDNNEEILEIQEGLDGISVEEKEVLEKLFKTTQQIDEMERIKSKLLEEIEKLNMEVLSIEKLIAEETLTYEENLKKMEKVLKAYQKKGPSSYIELILSSDSLTTLLRRLHVLNDITSKTNELLSSIKESKQKLETERIRIEEKIALIKEQESELNETIIMNQKVKEELEMQLAILEEERVKFETFLGQVESGWEEIKSLFTEIIYIFSNMLNDDSIPQDAIKVEFSLFTLKGTLTESTFLDIVETQSFPTKLDFKFHDGQLQVNMPEKHLQLFGKFEIVEDRKLVFVVDEGNFLGMSLEKSSIEDLFSQGYMELDLTDILGKNKLKSIKISDDKIELHITPVLF